MTMREMLFFLMWMLLTFTTAQAYELQDCWKQFPPERQISNCSKIIDQSPPRDVLADALFHRGSAYAAKGMVTNAIEDYTAAIRLKPEDKHALAARATAHVSAQDFDKAIADYSAALAIDGKFATAYVGRGYAFLVKKELERAIDDFTTALGISPSYVPALNNRGLAFMKMGKLERAITDFNQAIERNQLYGLAFNNRGYAYEKLGEREKAIDDFRSALSIDPTLTGALAGLKRLSAAGNIAAQSSHRIAEGRRIAEKNCAWCHAIGPKGDSPNKQAPRFRDIQARHPILALREPITRAIVTPHDAMPKLGLTQPQIDSMIAYINSLQSAP
jgi:tetratricopeptide (TPR) repeat protein